VKKCASGKKKGNPQDEPEQQSGIIIGRPTKERPEVVRIFGGRTLVKPDRCFAGGSKSGRM